MSLSSLDLQLLLFFNIHVSPLVNTFFVILSYTIYLYTILIGIYFYRKKERNKFVHLLISISVGLVVATFLKYFINRPRPFVTYPNQVMPLLNETDPSFPSRHAFIAFLLLNFIPTKFSRFAKYFSVFYLLSIPISILYAGVHYPTDVFAGSILGFAFPYLVNEKISLKIWNVLPKQIRKLI